jgi:hypothetical protein
VDTTAASAAAKLINIVRRSSVAKALIHDTVAAPIAALASVARKNTTPWTHSCSLTGITSLARQTSPAVLLIAPLSTSMPRTPPLPKTRRHRNEPASRPAAELITRTCRLPALSACAIAARSEKNVMLRPIGTNTIWVARNSRYQLRVRTTVTPSR